GLLAMSGPRGLKCSGASTCVPECMLVSMITDCTPSLWWLWKFHCLELGKYGHVGVSAFHFCVRSTIRYPGNMLLLLCRYGDTIVCQVASSRPGQVRSRPGCTTPPAAA